MKNVFFIEPKKLKILIHSFLLEATFEVGALMVAWPSIRLYRRLWSTLMVHSYGVTLNIAIRDVDSYIVM